MLNIFNYSTDIFPVNYPETIIEKSDGITDAEKYLNELSEKTFLSLWSYPNLYTDQNKKNETSVGKELCDLLVIFENHIIIFSDKNCNFNDIPSGKLSDKELNIKWKRWYKKSIEKSAGQIYKAEDWIRNHSDRIFLDDKCKKRFPFDIANKKDVIIHRIVVTHSIADICKKYTGNKYGSFFIDSNIIGSEQEFSIGYINEYKKFVHILNDFSLNLLMKELDTAPDFINYLTRKEDLFKKTNVVAFGEEDMLAQYLSITDDNGIHNFIDKNNNDFFYKGNSEHNLIIFENGAWENIINNIQYLNKKKADKISYAWDYLLEKSIKHYMSGTQLYKNELTNMNEDMQMFTILSSFNRFERRYIAKSIITFVKMIGKGERGTRQILLNNNIILLIAIIPRDITRDITDEKVFREKRRNLLEKYVIASKIEHMFINKFIGLAIESIDSPNESEDFMYLDTADWNDDDIKKAKEIKNSLIQANLLKERNVKMAQVEEYPTINFDVKMNGKNRNKPCPCGSGKKFKNCCGKY